MHGKEYRITEVAAPNVLAMFLPFFPSLSIFRPEPNPCLLQAKADANPHLNTMFRIVFPRERSLRRDFNPKFMERYSCETDSYAVTVF